MRPEDVAHLRELSPQTAYEEAVKIPDALVKGTVSSWVLYDHDECGDHRHVIGWNGKSYY
jgi:hypothetical protein